MWLVLKTESEENFPKNFKKKNVYCMWKENENDIKKMKTKKHISNFVAEVDDVLTIDCRLKVPFGG